MGAASEPTYHFFGPPSRELTPDDATVAALFDRLTPGALWSFADGRDVDTRRLLLANEWVRTYRADALETFGVGALDSASSAYDAYVKAGSRETLKALGELRKSVIEEAQKVSQRAQDMTGAMWRDLAVAAVPFVLKIFPDAAKAPNRTVAGALAFSAAAFLAFSYLMQLYVNGRYLTQQDQSRAAWRRSLNIALSSQEIEEISDRPIREGVDVYVRVRTWVGAVYLVLFAVLLVFAVQQLKSTP